MIWQQSPPQMLDYLTYDADSTTTTTNTWLRSGTMVHINGNAHTWLCPFRSKFCVYIFMMRTNGYNYHHVERIFFETKDYTNSSYCVQTIRLVQLPILFVSPIPTWNKYSYELQIIGPDRSGRLFVWHFKKPLNTRKFTKKKQEQNI